MSQYQVNPSVHQKATRLVAEPSSQLKENKKQIILEANTNGYFPGTRIRVTQVTHSNVETCCEVFIDTEQKKDIKDFF